MDALFSTYEESDQQIKTVHLVKLTTNINTNRVKIKLKK